MLTDTTNSPFARVTPLSSHVTWTGGFWKDAADVNAKRTVPHLQNMFESSSISHIVENFRICAAGKSDDFDGTDFGDGDFYKWIEAAVYTAAQTGNQALFRQIEEYIALIAEAQEPDGYISTKQIIGERKNNGIKRFGNINDFEVYNFGHLFTAACLHKRITGSSSFLAIAEKAADCLKNMYEGNVRAGSAQTAVCPSHYMGLIELYRTTGNKKYLDLAQLSVTLRDSVTEGSDDNQDRVKLEEHSKIVGHAVRANYLYAGVADLYAETGKSSYLAVLHRVWDNLMRSKIHITGGCGALYNGASPYGNFFRHQLIHQAYGYEYQLPNLTAYNETCASIGYILWAYRMFQLEPKAEYFDAVERAMLNVNLAAVSLDGRKFFYENMLRREKHLDYELIWPTTRSEYIESYCCPPNLARTVAESGEYAYCCSKDTLWLGMYGENSAEVSLPNGAHFTIEQKTGYPYDGLICFTIHPAGRIPFKLNLRIPSWAESGSIKTDGTDYRITAGDSGSYYTVPISCDADTTLSLCLDMPVRCTIAHSKVEEDTNQAAVERGPLVFCIESQDVEGGSLSSLLLDLNASFSVVPMELSGRSLISLETRLYRIRYGNYQPDKLYQTLTYRGLEQVRVRFIPYFAWDNREFGEMRIWLPVAYR